MRRTQAIAGHAGKRCCGEIKEREKSESNYVGGTVLGWPRVVAMQRAGHDVQLELAILEHFEIPVLR